MNIQILFQEILQSDLRQLNRVIVSKTFSGILFGVSLNLNRKTCTGKNIENVIILKQFLAWQNVQKIPNGML